MERKTDLLIQAVKNKDVAQIKQYLEQGTKIKQILNCKTLITAIDTQDLIIVKLLIEHFKNGRMFDWKMENILRYAVREGNLNIIKYLLDQHPKISINKSDSKPKTLLYIAIENEHMEVIKYLLQKGADINAYSKEYKDTPLHLASTLGLLEIVNLLLEYNAQVNVFDNFESSPLQVAVESGYTKIAKVLIRAGSDLDHFDYHKNCALSIAVRNNMAEIVEDLIHFGATINEDELVYEAIKHDSLEALKALYQAGVSLINADDEGYTALMYASRFKQFSIVEYLLQIGVSPNTINEVDGQTALHYLFVGMLHLEPFKKCLELFVEYGFILEQKIRGVDIFSHTTTCGNYPAASLLIKYGFDVNFIDVNWVDHALFKLYRFKISEPFDNKYIPRMLDELYDLIKLVFCAGFDFKREITLKNFDGGRISNLISYLTSNPRSLKDLCRIRIRKVLGKKPMTKLYKLQLSKCLHDYLALDIL